MPNKKDLIGEKRRHLKMVKRCLKEISRLGGKDAEAFVRLKKKAEKYLKRAEAIDLGPDVKLKEEGVSDLMPLLEYRKKDV